MTCPGQLPGQEHLHWSRIRDKQRAVPAGWRVLPGKARPRHPALPRLLGPTVGLRNPRENQPRGGGEADAPLGVTPGSIKRRGARSGPLAPLLRRERVRRPAARRPVWFPFQTVSPTPSAGAARVRGHRTTAFSLPILQRRSGGGDV